MDEYNLTTLPNGIRVLTIPRKESPSVVAMVIVGVGSRYETAKQSGIAHFIEHNVFKGTVKRPNRGQVTNEIESIGGEMNAATSAEYTYYYAKSAPNGVSTILDVVMDVSTNMTFPKEDIEIERGNVLEEIRLMKDTPPKRLLREYLDFVWEGNSLGRDTLGTEENVSRFTREDMLTFVKNAYAKDNIMVVVAGNFDKERVVSMVNNFYSSASIPDFTSASYEPVVKTPIGPRVLLSSNEGQQAHIALGVTTFGNSDKRRFTLAVMNTIFGEGFGSRLFKKIRDELGLAYYVGSAHWEFVDTGLWFARAGVRIDKVDDAIKAITDELRLFKDINVTDDELSRAKAFISGRTLLGVETSDDVAGWYGFQAMLEDEVLSPQEAVNRINKVTKDDIKKLAVELIDDKRFSLGVMGPFESKERFEKLAVI